MNFRFVVTFEFLKQISHFRFMVRNQSSNRRLTDMFVLVKGEFSQQWQIIRIVYESDS